MLAWVRRGKIQYKKKRECVYGKFYQFIKGDENIAEVFEEKGIEVKFKELDKDNAHNYLASVREMKTVFETYVDSHHHIMLNMTGGTKIMALAAVAAIRKMPLIAEICYLDYSTNKITYLNTEDSKTPEYIAKIDSYIRLHGYRIDAIKDSENLYSPKNKNTDEHQERWIKDKKLAQSISAYAQGHIG